MCIRDSSATYAARHAAKNVVAAGLAAKCEIQLAYAIGVAKPVSIMVDTFGTGKLSDEEIAEIISRHFDLRPAAIILSLIHISTQENFKIMRKALDEVGEEVGRYIRLCNYSSGMCMPEIAAMGLSLIHIFL